MSEGSDSITAKSYEFLSGGGELGQMIRSYGWENTSLGPVDAWPQSLRTCVRIMLTSRQPIWVGWGKELIKLYNDPYKAIVGGKHPWALGKPSSVVWKDIWRDIQPLLHKAMNENEGTYVESQLLIMVRNGYPEETYYTFSYTPIPDENGNPAGIICANTDDTDRIISERQLKTLTQLGKRLTDAKSNSVVIKETISTLADNKHDFPFALFYSLAGTKAILADHTSLTDKAKSVPIEIDLTAQTDISALINEALALRKIATISDLVETFGPMPAGAWEIPPDKAIILPIAQAASKEAYGFLIIGCNPYRLLDDKYSSFFTLIADQVATSFGNVHLLEEERKRVEALAEIDRAKTTFFSNISHEFRTPLTLLLGPIEEALSDETLTEGGKAGLEVSYRNALRMQKLVNTLLDFSRIEAGKLEAQFTKVNINELTEGLAGTFRSAIEKAGMNLIINSRPIHADVYLDTEMWEKIVLNLISNAFKYSKQGTIALDISQNGSDIILTITDNGIGIPENQIEKIFDRFHRVENVTGRSQEGTGIGLAMVKELVKLHNGTISVQSKVGEGSVFTVTIPSGRSHIPESQLININTVSANEGAVAFVEEALKWLPEDQEQPQNKKEIPLKSIPVVLLADDNADMRDYVRRLLSVQFNVITAVDGEDAFSKLMQYKPDLLLSDIMMPKVDGFGLLKMVRTHAELKYTPVIFLSARAGEEAKVEGLDAGADDYIVKPFSAKELISRVFNHIRINQVRRETEKVLSELANAMPQMVWVVRPDGSLMYVNDRLTDYALDKVQGDWYNLIHPDDRAITHERWQNAITTSGVYEVEHRLLMKDEKYHWHLCKAIPQKDDQGVVMQWFGTSTDIHIAKEQAAILEEEVKNRTKELRELNAELQQSNDALQQFAHVASHDLKEPVRKIKTFSHRLQKEYGTLIPEKGQSFLDKVQSSADRMSTMIEGVLNYATLNAGEQLMEQIDLNKLMQDIETDLEVAISQKDAKLAIDSLPSIEGAPVLIYQLFYNLINNSLKFAQHGIAPIITIRGGITTDTPGFVQIVVADNGIGFEQEYAQRIFDSFARLNPKDKYEGTGLGLALCKRIAERHHGSISASGMPEQGAIFTVILPLKQA